MKLIERFLHLKRKESCKVSPPECIGELLMLKEQNLSNNKLREILECIENLSCLESLNLKANYWIKMPECIEKLKEQGLQIIF